MLRKRLFHSVFMFLLGLGLVHAQQKKTISGFVTDATSGEKLIGAQVFDPVAKIGAVTNAYGFYSITSDVDTIRLTCSYMGYQSYTNAFVFSKDMTVHIGLEPEDVSVDVVEITGETDISESSQMSTVTVPIETIKKLPALMGEVDVIKALQLLPGVQSGSEGSSGFYVRGGGPDQNLILLDGVPVYNVSHLFGFFSVFPADAIQNVNLIKGGFPARYGGRLSSVLDLSLKEGNMNEFHGEGSVGLIASKLTLEGPIVKGKTSFMVSGRRTYLDILTQPLILAASEGNTTGGYYFYDGVGKINHRFSDKDRLYLSFYGGRDKFYLRDSFEETYQGVQYVSENKFGLGWGNMIGSVRWNHLFSQRLFGNLTATFSDYDFKVDAEISDSQTQNGTTTSESFRARYDSGIRDWSAKMDFDFFANSNHLVRFGAYGIRHTFTPGVSVFELETGNVSIDTTFGNQKVIAGEVGVYIEDEFKIGTRHKTNVGLHASGFLVDGEFYRSLQPRLSHRTMLDENWAFKASFASMYQFIHLLSNTNVGLPTDLWVPTTDVVKPQTSWQGAVGLTRNLWNKQLEFSVEGYYKYMQNLVEYREGAAFLEFDNDWEEKVTQGQGWSYGGELFLQKKYGKTTGWVGYTLSWTNRQFDDLNGGEIYPFKYDRRHDFSLVLTHNFSERVDAGLTWVYGTGNAVTLPIASYNGMNLSPLDQVTYQYPADYYDGRNSFRMRAYHRLDLGVNLHKDLGKWKRTWAFSVYNAYSRQNPFFLFFDENARGETVLKQVSLFPIIPSVAFRFEF